MGATADRSNRAEVDLGAPDPPWPALRLFLPAVLAAHALLLASSLGFEGLLSRPLANVDYWSHFYAATHAAAHFANTLSVWGYDPHWMAGYPEGFVSLADNKLFDLLVALAPRPLEAAVFNLTILLIVLSVPLVLHGSARAAGLGPAGASGAALAGVVLTFGAPMTMLFWTGGGISFFLASLLSVPGGLGLARALRESSLASREGVRSVAVVVLAAFVHPFCLLPIGAAVATVLLDPPRPRARIVAELAVVGALLLLPLLPLVAGVLVNRGQTRLFTHLFPGGPAQLVRDWVTHLFRTDDVTFHGAGSLAAVTVAAAAGLVARRGAEEIGTTAFRAILAALAATAGLAYVAAPLHPRLAALQPQRFLVAFGFFAAIPAGRGLLLLVSGLRSRRASAWILAVLLAALVIEGIVSLTRVRYVATGFDPAEEGMSAFLDRHAPGEGRVLVESGLWPIPAAEGSRRQVLVHRFTLLPLRIDREFLGVTGLGLFAAQRHAGFGFGKFLGRNLGGLSGEEVRDLLARYAVGTVVACSRYTMGLLERYPKVLETVGTVAECRGYRVRNAETSRFLEGEGEVRADLDRIEVRGARGERLVLKYHWMPILVTDPPLAIEEARQPGSPVGFIAVRPRGTADFTIRNPGLRRW